jgi:hypothetical protein
LRWPAAVLLSGTSLVLAEIITSQVLLSQIGNILVWVASAAFACYWFAGAARSSARSAACTSASRGPAPGCHEHPTLNAATRLLSTACGRRPGRLACSVRRRREPQARHLGGIDDVEIDMKDERPCGNQVRADLVDVAAPDGTDGEVVHLARVEVAGVDEDGLILRERPHAQGSGSLSGSPPMAIRRAIPPR